MSISSVSSKINITDLSQNSSIKPGIDQTNNQNVISKPGISPQELNFTASTIKDRLLSSLTNGSNSGSNPAPVPALNPRQVFLSPVKSLISNNLSLPANRFKDNKTTLAVNSANQLQFSQVVLKGNGTLTQFSGLPPSNPIPPQTTAQLPRVVLDPKGVLSYAKNAQPLTNDQRSAIQTLYSLDQVSRGNYAKNLQNLASALTSIKNNSCLNNSDKRMIDNSICTLKGAYNTLADFNKPSPDPDKIYQAIGQTLANLDNSYGVDGKQLKTAENILGIGYANYLFNRVPVNGTNNPATTVRGPLAAFDAKAPLSTAQGNPAAVFGDGLNSYLNSIGIKNIDVKSVSYQVNSADAIQAAIVPLGKDANMTLFFSGQFPPTNANPPQIAFSGTNGARRFADIANNDPTTQQRLSNFFTANAAPRAAYATNLTNLIAGFQTLSKGKQLPESAKAAINDSITRLQAAANGLNNATPTIPNVLKLYQQIGDNLDKLSSVKNFNKDQRQALETLNRSTLPIGIINYFARPVVLSQQS